MITNGHMIPLEGDKKVLTWILEILHNPRNIVR